jgi:uncharacterized protein
MRHEAPFRVHAGELLRRPGIARSHRLAIPVDWGIELSRVLEDPPLTADLKLVATAGGIVVRGTADVTVVHTCARCLDEFPEPATVEITQLVEIGPEADEDSEYRLVGEEIDLEPLLRDEVLLAQPLLPHCDRCTQLVEPPESDLNTPAPGEAGRPESPFAVLQDLFEPGE